MTEQATIRRCGNCDQPVGKDDVICPHCDVLLAAYEAPPGATTGTASAVNPVKVDTISTDPAPATMTPEPTISTGHREPYVSPTAQTLHELDAQKPEVGTTSTTFDLPQSSPVAKALERTRIAADLDAKGRRPDQTSIDAPSLDQDAAEEESRQLFGMSVKSITSPAPGPQHPQAEPSPQDQPTAAEVLTDEDRQVHQIARAATAPRPVRPRPEQRPTTVTQPIRPSEHTPNTKSGSKPTVSTFIGVFIVIVLVTRILGSGAFTGFIFIPIIIVGLVWYMTRMAKNTGRKTTHMPKDKDRRK